MHKFVSKETVSWAHCDAAGIVFYPQFYIWFDQSTERYFSANGLSYQELSSIFGISGMPLLETGATYKRPCELGVQLDITTWIDEWKPKTFLVKHRVSRKDASIALEGFERRAMVVSDAEAKGRMRAIEIPEEIKHRFIVER